MQKIKYFLILLIIISISTIALSQNAGLSLLESENLSLCTFRNGDTILHAQSMEQWKQASQNKIPAYCYHDELDVLMPDDSNLKTNTFGYLYNWYAVEDSRGLAPIGYDIASEEDWQKSITSTSKLIGAIMLQKKNNLTNMAQPNIHGFRNHFGGFSDWNNKSGWWLIKESDFENARTFIVTTESANNDDHFHSYNKGNGFYVKCVKN